MENVDKDMIVVWIKEGHSYAWISDELKKLFPSQLRGISARSVRRFCNKFGIKKMSLQELDTVIETAVDEVYVLTKFRTKF